MSKQSSNNNIEEMRIKYNCRTHTVLPNTIE